MATPPTDIENPVMRPAIAVSNATSLAQARQKYEFFWKTASPFSQWHPAYFHVNGLTYNCAEQYMMHQKAELFGDENAARQILRSKDPSFQKKMGRKVHNFDAKIWDKECISIVKTANKAKFEQNLKMKEILFSTYPKDLVEASPTDNIWGIGYTEDNDRAWNQSTWIGQNLLGLVLTDVRNELMKKEGLLT